MTGPSIRFPRKKSKKQKASGGLFSEAEMRAYSGNNYCQNYDAYNPTCVQCAENGEGPFRAGCFKRVEK